MHVFVYVYNLYLFVCIRVCMYTQLAKIIKQTTQKEGKTSLQVEIDRLVQIVASFAGLTTVVVVLYWVLYLRVQHSAFMNLSSMISNVIGVTISFVPEGLPLVCVMEVYLIIHV